MTKNVLKYKRINLEHEIAGYELQLMKLGNTCMEGIEYNNKVKEIHESIARCEGKIQIYTEWIDSLDWINSSLT